MADIEMMAIKARTQSFSVGVLIGKYLRDRKKEEDEKNNSNSTNSNHAIKLCK